MTEFDVSGLAEALADERILEPEQFEEFRSAMLPICQETRILAKELAYRGWLTPFQLEHILAGHVESLFLGSYVLLEQIGEGGGGSIYRARNWKLNRIVAIKVIGEEQARHPAAIARFQREIRALGRIRHPNIVMALDADFHPGSIYYAMEYFDGTDLARYVAGQGPLSIADACNYILQTADALQHASECGLVHRDIKPSNIFLTEPDHIIKVLDLGLSRCEVPVGDSVFNQLTRAGALIGTPDYMSPEQVKDSRGTDIRSDLYSLGCTFYYLLTGHAPFHHLTAVVDKVYAQIESQPPPIEDRRPDVPPEIANIVRKLMAKRRRDRFQTPAELAAVLKLLLGSSAALTDDTLLDVKSQTSVSRPALALGNMEAARTVFLSHSEIELVTEGDEQDGKSRKKRSWRALLPVTSHLVTAVSVAVLALVMIWKTGVAPSSNRPASAEPLTPPVTMNDSAPNENEGRQEVIHRTEAKDEHLSGAAIPAFDN